MADSITKCVFFEHEDSSKNYHVVHYHIEDGENATEISVIVYSFEMENPEDLDELKTLSNLRATAAKQHWISTLIKPDETPVNISGEVSL